MPIRSARELPFLTGVTQKNYFAGRVAFSRVISYNDIMKNGASESGYRFSTRCARAGARHGDRGGNGRRQMTHAGGLLSFVTRPAKSSHRGMTPEGRRQAGASESLILAAGIEATDDHTADLELVITQEK